MVNTDEFIQRMEQILQYYGLSASAFADRIGVQRSSLSHLLSGRNKPSLDFVMKICDEFQEVDLYWFLQGKGQFPKSDSNKVTNPLFQDSKQNENSSRVASSLFDDSHDLIKKKNAEPEVIHDTIDGSKEIEKPSNEASDELPLSQPSMAAKKDVETLLNCPSQDLESMQAQEKLVPQIKSLVTNSNIDQIVIFYADGTFKAYHARN
jgi:transcriptional regulator with XRE-family HTH domain